MGQTMRCYKWSLLLAMMLVLMASTTGWAETVITLAMRGGQNYLDGVNAALPLFYKLYPDIKVEVIPNYGRDKFRTSVAAGAPPDIYAEGAQYIISHASSGLIQPLDKFINDTKLPMNNFVPPNVDLARWQGHVYAVPWASDINFAFFRNTELLRQAGYDGSKAVTTVKELDTISKRMLKVNGAGQLEYAPFMPWLAGVTGNGLFTMSLAFGGSFFETKTGAFTTANQFNVAALEWMVDYARRYQEAGVWAVLNASASMAALAPQNKAVFGFVYPSQALGLKTKNPGLSFELGPVPNVEGQGAENPVWVAGTEFIMPIGVPHPQEAFKLITFLSSHPEGSALAAHGANIFPANLRSPYHKDLQDDPISRVFYQQASVARYYRPPVPNQDFWTATLTSAVTSAISLQVPANQALIEADRKIRADYDETMAALKK